MSAVGRDNVQDQNWPCELDHELLMVSLDIENRDDEDVGNTLRGHPAGRKKHLDPVWR